MAKFAIAVAAVLAISSAAMAEEMRSHAVLDEFQREQPCPSTGLTHHLCVYASGGRHCDRCPGYVIDHIKPLACGGADAVSNMQWQTIEAGKAKDRWELNCSLWD